MKPTVYQNDDGTWEFRTHYIDGNGTRRQVRRRRKTERQAQATYAKFVKDRDAGVLATGKVMTVAELMDWWLQISSDEGVRDNTTSGHRVLMNAYVIPHIGDVKSDRLNEDHIRTVLRWLADQGYSDSTIKDMRARLKAMCTRAVRERKMTRNPVDNVKAPRGKAAREHIILSPDECKKFVAAAHEERLGALWILAINTGMRRGELAGLRWSRVDLELGALVIPEEGGNRTVTMESNIVEGAPKTDAGVRRIPLTPMVVAALRKWKATQAHERLLLGRRWEGDDYVFTSRDGEEYHPQTLGSNLTVFCKRAEVRVLPLHHLRHTYATNALRAGVDVKVVSQMLGHANVALTINLYMHVDPAMEDDAQAKIQDFMFG